MSFSLSNRSFYVLAAVIFGAAILSFLHTFQTIDENTISSASETKKVTHPASNRPSWVRENQVSETLLTGVLSHDQDLDISTAADAFEQAVAENPNALSQEDLRVVSQLLTNLRIHAEAEAITK